MSWRPPLGARYDIFGSDSKNIFELGDMVVFGGTSSTAPQLAAAAALLRQHDPTLEAAGVKEALQRGALSAGSMAKASWGYGKLRIFRSIFDADPSPNTPPSVEIDHPATIRAAERIEISARIDDAEDRADDLLVRWDDGYDGAYEGDWASDRVLHKTFARAGRHRIKVEVQDSGGLRAAAAVLLDVLEPSDEDRDGNAAAGDSATLDAGPPGLDGSEQGSSPGGCSAASDAGDGSAAALALPVLLWLTLLAQRRSS